jgi:serine/threonine protein kinase
MCSSPILVLIGRRRLADHCSMLTALLLSGLSKEIEFKDALTTTICGSPEYMAPGRLNLCFSCSHCFSLATLIIGLISLKKIMTFVLRPH